MHARGKGPNTKPLIITHGWPSSFVEMVKIIPLLTATSDGAYAHMQRTTPQTYGYGLNDSPAGLTAVIIEKFRAWSDCDGKIEQRFTKDELLTNITLYWVTQTINSSMRIYYESKQKPWILGVNERISVPLCNGTL